MACVVKTTAAFTRSVGEDHPNHTLQRRAINRPLGLADRLRPPYMQP
jgi:hypothetical protein